MYTPFSRTFSHMADAYVHHMPCTLQWHCCHFSCCMFFATKHQRLPCTKQQMQHIIWLHAKQHPENHPAAAKARKDRLTMSLTIQLGSKIGEA